MHQTQWGPERPLPPPVSLASQSHHEKPPEVTCTSRGNPGFPASTRERPRETFFNTSRGHIPLPWLGSNDALPLATRMETRLPWRPTRGSLTSPSYLVRNRTLGPPLEAGATTLNAPDTVGYTTPAEIAALFEYLRRHVRGAERAIFSSHCHNDLGMAVANSLAAVSAGARQVECTINGIGERAGNAALEEVVMALKVRAAHFGVDTRVDSRKLYPTSRLLTQLTGQAMPRNKAIVGENAFAHEAGIHQHGMLKHRGTYEIMRPQDVGIAETRLVLGKHSGRAALSQRLQALGYTPDAAAMDTIFARFKKLADKKREIHDEDLEAIALGHDPEAAGPWHLLQLSSATHLGGSASASVKLAHDDGREASEAAIGDGPVDAVLRAIERATGSELELTDFLVRAVSEGGDAQGQARLTARYHQRDWRGHGVSTDIVEATALAALAIVNRIARQGTQDPPIKKRPSVAARSHVHTRTHKGTPA